MSISAETGKSSSPKPVSILLIFLFFCSITKLFATDKSFLDSVKHVLLNTKDKAEKINCLYTLSFEYGFIEPRKGIDYGKECLRLARETGDIFNQLNAYNGLGNCYETLGDFDSARYCHQKTYELARFLKDKRRMATALLNVGITYKEQGDYKEALDTDLGAYKILETEPTYNPRVHFFLGEMYMRIGNYEQAEYHSRLGIRKCTEFNHTYVRENMYINLAKCLHARGESDSAVALLNHTLAELKKYTDQLSICFCLNALGLVHTERKEYAQALNYFTEELSLQQQMKNESGICLSYLDIADAMAHLGGRSKATVSNILQQAIGRLSSIKRNKDDLRASYLKVAQAYEEIGEPENALAYFKLFNRLSDSLLNKEKFRQMNELQTRYETDKKVKLIELQKAEIKNQWLDLQRRNFQLLSITAIFLFSVILGLFFYSRYRAKQKLRFMLEVQKQEQMREIALKNKESQERERISRDIHDELGAGLSKIALLAEFTRQQIKEEKLNENVRTISSTAKELSDNMRNLVWALNPGNNTLDNLVARIREYANEYFEELPIQSELDFPDDVPALRISKEAQRNIFLTFKEAMNNSVKHSGGNKIRIHLSLEKDTLHLSVADNGKGFESDQRKSGSGMRNMEQRIRNIGGTYKLITGNEGTVISADVKLDCMSA